MRDGKNFYVRCNECEGVFEEDDLLIDEEGFEHCPDCLSDYALMDLIEEKKE